MLITNVSKIWAMPSGKTFKITPIRDIILKYVNYKLLEVDRTVEIIDPFANEASIRQLLLDKNVFYVSNDID